MTSSIRTLLALLLALGLALGASLTAPSLGAAQEIIHDDEEDEAPNARQNGLRLQPPAILGGARQQPSEGLRLPPPGGTTADQALDQALEDDEWLGADEAEAEPFDPAQAAEDEAWLRGELDSANAVPEPTEDEHLGHAHGDDDHGDEAHEHGDHEHGDHAHGEHGDHAHGEHGAEHGGHEEHFDPVQFGATLLNFFIWLALIVWLLRKPLGSFLQTRRRDVEEGLVEAKRLKKEATEKYDEYSERLAHLDDELAQLRKEMIQAGEAERDRIIEDAEERAARMRRDASFVIQQQIKQLRADLTQEAIEAAVTAAEKVLVEQIGAPDQQRLADSYLTDLGDSIREEEVSA